MEVNRDFVMQTMTGEATRWEWSCHVTPEDPAHVSLPQVHAGRRVGDDGAHGSARSAEPRRQETAAAGIRNQRVVRPDAAGESLACEAGELCRRGEGV